MLNSVSNLSNIFDLRLHNFFCNTLISKITTGGGLALGGVMSLLFFKRRIWPVYVGSGFGIGVAYTNCERSLNTK